MTETLVVVSPPSKKLRKASGKEPASPTAPPGAGPLPPGEAEPVGGLLGRPPVQAEPTTLAEQELEVARELVR